MNLFEAQRQAAEAIVAEAVASMPKGMGGFQARVEMVSPLTLSWQGKKFRSPKARGYTPTVGDQVLVQLIGSGPIVIDAIDPI